jgi:hypothetical protein
MPARDIFHDAVKNALIKDGWTITDDPLRLEWGKKNLYVDLGAERLLVAEKGERKIAVEVKSFVGASEIRDLEQALGQYLIYRLILQRNEPERTLYLAVSEEVFQNVFGKDVGRLVLEMQGLPMIIFDEIAEVILKWML